MVEARELVHVYPDGSQALRGVSFRVEHGESVAVVGANGSGKSTLLLHFAGCLLPGEGEVRVGDVPVSAGTLETVRRAVGLVFQNPDDQLFLSSVAEDVAFGPRNLGLPEDEVARRVDTALAQVGALEIKDRAPYRLSGGEKRLAAIATVLSVWPDVLVMDEPSANLDPFARRALIRLLRTFSHTKIIATHDLDMALDVCTRAIVLNRGRVAADGPILDILRDEALLASCRLEKPLRLQGCPVCSGRQGDDPGLDSPGRAC